MDRAKSYNIKDNIDGHVCKAFLSSTNLYSEGEDRRRGGKESYTCRPMIMLCSLAGVNILTLDGNNVMHGWACMYVCIAFHCSHL